MKTKRVLARGAVLAAALGLMSCADFDHHHHVPPGGGDSVVPPQPGKGGRFDCPTGAVCELTVNVETCTVVEDQTTVLRGQIVRWRAPSGSRFAVNGIEFKPGAVDPARAFDMPQAGGSHFQWHVMPGAPSNPAGYAYRVRVTGPSGKTCDFDPAIWV